MKSKALTLFSGVLALLTLACGGTYLATPTLAVSTIYPSITSEATQETPVEVLNTPTPPIYTTRTLVPSTATNTTVQLCVSATETVNLRPSASEKGYPITQLKNGQVVVSLGGRQGEWIYVSVNEKMQGWINGKYLSNCK
jgi:hypothetical protein